MELTFHRLTMVGTALFVASCRPAGVLDPQGPIASAERPLLIKSTAIMLVVNSLPEDQRTVVLLIGLEEMRYDRVATILNVPAGTVRSRLARGRAELRRLMSAGQAVQAQQAFAPGLGPVTVR
jgi:DNA-directed RNA polymerase specialized sigma24 family protein